MGRLRLLKNVAITTLKLVRLAAAILFILVATFVGVGAVLWRYQSDFLARYVSSTVTRELLQDDFRLDIRDISGSPFAAITLHGVSVLGPDRTEMLWIDEVRFRYPPKWGFQRELSLEALTVSNARARLVEREGGGIVPPWRASARKTSPLEPRPAHRVEKLSLADVDVCLVTAAGDTVEITRDFYLDGSLRVATGGTVLRVKGSAGEVPVANLDVDWLTFAATLESDRISFENVVADVGFSHAEGAGVLALGEPLNYRFDVEKAHVETRDAWNAIDLGEVIGHGAVDGRFRVEKAPLGVYLGWEVAGVLNDDPIERLEGRVQITEEEIDVVGLVLESRGSRVSGNVTLDVEAPRSYRAELDAVNLDLTDVPIHDALVPLHPHRLDGHVVLRGTDYELEFPHMSIRAEAVGSTYLGVPVDKLEVVLELVPGDSILVTRAVAELGSGVVDASGYIVADETCALDVVARSFPLERLAPLHQLEGLAGSCDVVAFIHGDVEHPRFEGSGTVAGGGIPGVNTELVEVPAISGRLVPFRADLSARASDVWAWSWHADSLELTASLGDTIDVRALHAVAGDSVLTLSGSLAVASTGDVSAELERLTLDVPAGNAVLSAPAPLVRRPDGRLALGPATFGFAGGEVRVGVASEAEGRRMTTTLAADGIPLFDLLDPHLPALSLHGGTSTLELVHVADPDTPVLMGRARFDSLGVGELRATSASFAFEGRSDTLRVEDVAVATEGGEISGRLMLAGVGSAVKDLLSPDPLGALARPERRIEAHGIATTLDVGLVATIAELVRPADEDTSSVARLLYSRDRAAAQDMWHAFEGEADVTLGVSGTLSNPELRLSFLSDSLVVRHQPLDGVRVVCVYADSVLTISQGEIVAGRHTTQITGFVPVFVDLADRRVGPVDREMLVALDMPETPLSLLSVIFPELVVIAGHVTGSGTLAGTPHDPLLDGTFRVEGGELRLAGRTEWLWDGSGTVTLTNRAVIINDFKAREGSKGRLRANGNWSRTNDYRFQVELEDFTVAESGMLGLVDGTINVSPDERTAGRLLPRFDGVVRVTNGEIFQWPEEGPEQTSGTIDAIYDLAVDVARVNVNTNELQTTTNAVIGDGELTVRNYPETLRLGGTLRVLEGGGTVYGNQFRVRRGDLTFLEVDGVNPQLDIVAETRIRSAYARQRGITAASPKILATITGTLKEPVVRLSTEPPDLGLTQTEIMEYLTIGRFTTDGDGAGGLEPTAEILLGLIAQDIARALPYVDHVEVTTSEESPSISFVTSLSDEWTIGYTTGVSSSPDQEISIEARLSRILVLKGGVIREEFGTSGDPGGRYNLDLRLNFEY